MCWCVDTIALELSLDKISFIWAQVSHCNFTPSMPQVVLKMTGVNELIYFLQTAFSMKSIVLECPRVSLISVLCREPSLHDKRAVKGPFVDIPIFIQKLSFSLGNIRWPLSLIKWASGPGHFSPATLLPFLQLSFVNYSAVVLDVCFSVLEKMNVGGLFQILHRFCIDGSTVIVQRWICSLSFIQLRNFALSANPLIPHINISCYPDKLSKVDLGIHSLGPWCYINIHLFRCLVHARTASISTIYPRTAAIACIHLNADSSSIPVRCVRTVEIMSHIDRARVIDDDCLLIEVSSSLSSRTETAPFLYGLWSTAYYSLT